MKDLLIPRFKVIADYPNSWFILGNIYTGLKGANPNSDYWYLKDNSPHGVGTVDPTKYPSVFQRLQWWENRTPLEMPRYLKKDNMVFKVRAYTHPAAKGFPLFYEKDEIPGSHYISYFQPATKEEYNLFIKNRK